jgi:hypothetical protein
MLEKLNWSGGGGTVDLSRVDFPARRVYARKGTSTKPTASENTLEMEK